FDVSEAYIAHSLAEVSRHPNFKPAKAGIKAAAVRLAKKLVSNDVAREVKTRLAGERPIVLPVLAREQTGENKVPAAVAHVLAKKIGLDVVENITQVTRPQRTELSGLDRIFAQPEFDGPVVPGQTYLLVDDVLTQGGTFAALASHIEQNGGRVVGAFALAGKQYSRTLAPTAATLSTLRAQYGDIEQDFRAATGYGFDALTESEARYLAKYSPPQSVRDRILEEGRARGGRADQAGSASPAARLSDDEALYSRAGDTSDQSGSAFAAEVLRELGAIDELFKNPTTKARTVKDVLADLAPDIQYGGIERSTSSDDWFGAKHRYVAKLPNSRPMYIYERGREVWLDVSENERGGGGDRVYQTVADYARNTGRRFIGDPAGLSADAIVRRTYHMLSNMVRYGDSKGFEPADAQ
ncbi:MAG: hypothetical protein ACREXP_28660, partial [Steroidobacteraceae bacterium]